MGIIVSLTLGNTAADQRRAGWQSGVGDFNLSQIRALKGNSLPRDPGMVHHLAVSLRIGVGDA